jgi:hypothetical protein
VLGGVELDGVLLPGAVEGALLEDEAGGVLFGVVVVVEVSDRLVDDVPVLGRSHAAIPIASNAGNATMRIRFTGFS